MDEESMWKGFYEKLQQQKSVEEQVHDSRWTPIGPQADAIWILWTQNGKIACFSYLYLCRIKHQMRCPKLCIKLDKTI
ncbi:jg16314 [Pararge aegeria aegeria]|uniref:Jg16314 protein n=1 Tax=Pararge aegeria aegeria TaxID=348720 RepID=A0A8S4RTX6_9NEOP|nr:jg16314 [Pararge aegeria aegeria]